MWLRSRFYQNQVPEWGAAYVHYDDLLDLVRLIPKDARTCYGPVQHRHEYDPDADLPPDADVDSTRSRSPFLSDNIPLGYATSLTSPPRRSRRASARTRAGAWGMLAAAASGAVRKVTGGKGPGQAEAAPLLGGSDSDVSASDYGPDLLSPSAPSPPSHSHSLSRTSRGSAHGPGHAHTPTAPPAPAPRGQEKGQGKGKGGRRGSIDTALASNSGKTPTHLECDPASCSATGDGSACQFQQSPCPSPTGTCTRPGACPGPSPGPCDYGSFLSSPLSAAVTASTSATTASTLGPGASLVAAAAAAAGFCAPHAVESRFVALFLSDLLRTEQFYLRTHDLLDSELETLISRCLTYRSRDIAAIQASTTVPSAAEAAAASSAAPGAGVAGTATSGAASGASGAGADTPSSEGISLQARSYYGTFAANTATAVAAAASAAAAAAAAARDRAAAEAADAELRKGLRRAFRELYRGVSMLHGYCRLNAAALAAAALAHDQASPLQLEGALMERVDKSLFSRSTWCSWAENCLVRAYMSTFHVDEAAAARAIKAEAEPTPGGLESRLSFLLGMNACVVLALVALAALVPESTAAPFFTASAPLFRLLLLVCLAIYLWGAVVWACERTGVNHVFVLGMDPRTTLRSLQVWYAGSTLAFAALASGLVCSVLYLRAWLVEIGNQAESAAESAVMFATPTIIHTCVFAAFLIACVIPANVFWFPSRRYLARNFKKVILFPFYPVSFELTFLGDQLCSFSKVTFDLVYALCFYFSSSFLPVIASQLWAALSEAAEAADPRGRKAHKHKFMSASSSSMLSDGIIIDPAAAVPEASALTCLRCKPIVRNTQWALSTLPFVLRAGQCLTLYRAKGDIRQLLNFGKYSAAVLMTAAAYLYRASLATLAELEASGSGATAADIAAAAAWEQGMRGAFAGMAIIATGAQYFWDLRMDFGFLELGPSFPYRQASVLGPYAQRVYGFAMVANLLMRLVWVETIFPSSMGVSVLQDELFVLFLACIELCRRNMWNFIRLENEHLNNVGEFRAFNIHIPEVPPLVGSPCEGLSPVVDTDKGGMEGGLLPALPAIANAGDGAPTSDAGVGYDDDDDYEEDDEEKSISMPLAASKGAHRQGKGATSPSFEVKPHSLLPHSLSHSHAHSHPHPSHAHAHGPAHRHRREAEPNRSRLAATAASAAAAVSAAASAASAAASSAGAAAANLFRSSSSASLTPLPSPLPSPTSLSPSAGAALSSAASGSSSAAGGAGSVAPSPAIRVSIPGTASSSSAAGASGAAGASAGPSRLLVQAGGAGLARTLLAAQAVERARRRFLELLARRRERRASVNGSLGSRK